VLKRQTDDWQQSLHRAYFDCDLVIFIKNVRLEILSKHSPSRGTRRLSTIRKYHL